MSEVEFAVNQESLAIIENTPLEANFDEVKAALTEMVMPYKTMVVSEDGIAAAKADRAKIRKVASRVDEVRKTIKKQYMKPYDDFEAKCRELVSVCTDGSDNLDKQIKAFEDKTAEKKIETLRGEYVAMTDEQTEQFCPWGAINNPKWRNATYKYDDAVAEIRQAIENTRKDLETIRNMGGEDTVFLLDIYRQTRDLTAVVRKASELKTMRQREEQREREEERIRKAQDANRLAALQSETFYEAQPSAEELMQADVVTVSFKVVCTKAQLKALGQYMTENGIRYSRA